MHFLIEVVAYELAHAQYRFLLYIKHLVIHEHIRVLVQVEGVLDPIHIGFELPKPVILDL